VQVRFGKVLNLTQAITNAEGLNDIRKHSVNLGRRFENYPMELFFSTVGGGVKLNAVVVVVVVVDIFIVF